MEIEIKAIMAGKKVKLKSANEIDQVPKDKRVILLFKNGEEYHGIFKSINDSEILIQSLTSSQIIGLPKNKLLEFYQEK